MSNAALTAKYRPQTFAEVAGQETLKAILSRAAQEDKVAPAYLFSGTRGVGKTTLARIFAKALNCRKGPAAEPCNQCDLCRSVTLGNAVDVVEIDGASNRGIDDVRRLKEVVGYAPMDGRYKVFIIDEAHMLSREAFNALLKTLEEPPARVTFIMATTEPHKFPATIISRCQHYVFKRLPEAGLVDHLRGVLARENIAFEESAVRLIARRGAGSVRDSMSLLGQVLALGSGALTEEAARSVLGLAGQEAFMRLLAAFRDSDSLTLTAVLREMLDQGLDMGFFLRELSSLWRNMFILRQSGRAALPVVDVPEAEALALLEASKDFSLTHIHACWQMTLEGQRRVLTSLEPALALELLLLNLAMLPQILSLESISTLGRRGGPASGGSGGPAGPGGAGSPGGLSGSGQPGAGGRTPSGMGTPQSPPSGGMRPAPQQEYENQSSLERASGQSVGFASPAPMAPPAPVSQEIRETLEATTETAAGHTPPAASFSAAEPELPEAVDTFATENDTPPVSFSNAEPKTPAAPEGSSLEPAASNVAIPEPPHMPEPPASLFQDPHGVEQAMWEPDDSVPPDADWAAAADWTPDAEDEEIPIFMPDSGVQTPSDTRAAHPAWEEILAECARREAPPWFAPLAQRISAVWREDRLVLAPQDAFTGQRIQDPISREILDAALAALCGGVPALEVLEPVSDRKDRDDLKKEVYEHPLVLEMQKSFGARIVDYGQLR